MSAFPTRTALLQARRSLSAKQAALVKIAQLIREADSNGQTSVAVLGMFPQSVFVGPNGDTVSIDDIVAVASLAGHSVFVNDAKTLLTIDWS